GPTPSPPGFPAARAAPAAAIRQLAYSSDKLIMIYDNVSVNGGFLPQRRQQAVATGNERT
ncbi:MAG TPA: hypothetical protein DD670_01635, partial [Planctomycetaceae bacterium]|nr:hypothetical protein [Planctomycetaceae bacterium]